MRWLDFALLIMLNGFGGYAGEVKIKSGKIRKYYEESRRNILKQASEIADVKFIHHDYQSWNISGSLIYCDPPYAQKTDYRTTFDSKQFWDWVTQMSKSNIVLVSEYQASEQFKVIFEKELIVSLDKSSRKVETEKLFIHKDLAERLEIKCQT